MIARIRGEVVDIGPNSVVVEAGGVGYEVLIPEPVAQDINLNAELTLLTYHHVRESGQELFGFTSRGQKELFALLIGVSGVGPKGALAIMSLSEHEQVRKAIASGNIVFIAGAQGIGKKSAERIVVELKDKVGVVGGEVVDIPDDDDAHAALMALGYTASQAAQALQGIKNELSTEERVKLALKELS